MGALNNFLANVGVTGTVTTADNAEARALAGQGFMGHFYAPAPGPGLRNAYFLKNIPGSTKNVFIRKFKVWAATVPNQITFGFRNGAELTTILGFAMPKKFDTGTVNGTLSTSSRASAQSDALTDYITSTSNETVIELVTAKVPIEIIFDDPIVLTPGLGFVIQNGTLNVDLNLNIELYEKPV